MAANDNWHAHPGRDCCGSSVPVPVSPFAAFPSPLAFPPPPPRCPATKRHENGSTGRPAGLQCHYTPLHDGDHAAYAGPGEGDIFWPQEAPA